MTTDLDVLKKYDDRILELVNKYKLNCYPQEFEICDHNDMLGYMAYSGMPARYSHWSFGKNFERTKMMYNYGVQGLPYEMVINSNPCLAYLMRDNTLLLQILTIAHVYGHNDFFANNFTFTSGTEAHLVLEKFKMHGRRIESYIEDPSIGIEAVEHAIDDAHALQFQCRRNLAIRKLSRREQLEKLAARVNPKRDEHWEIHPEEKVESVDFDKNPLEPDEDVLLFIAENNPYMPEWKRDVLRIVDYEAKYFIPQIETKIMNEGWASYWHFKILNELKLENEHHLEFLVRHNQVLRPHPGGLNPYHLGFMMYHDIERRVNSMSIEDDREVDIDQAAGREKIFQIREVDRDVSFIRQYLTPELMRELQLFQHEKRGKDRIITVVADDKGWEKVKENLIRSVGISSMPVIKVEDADFLGSRTLLVRHHHDGRDLDLGYAEKSMQHLESLWGKDVVLMTEVNGKEIELRCSGGEVKKR